MIAYYWIRFQLAAKRGLSTLSPMITLLSPQKRRLLGERAVLGRGQLRSPS
jgi:hypothetical protein